MAFLRKLIRLYVYRAQVYRNFSNCVQLSLSQNPVAFKNNSRQDILNCCEKKYNVVLAKSHVSKETWEEIKKFIADMTIVDSVIIDGMILDLCSTESLADAGISYYKLLEENNCKSFSSLIIAAKYLCLQYLKKDPITKEDERKILNIVGTIVEQCPVLDKYVATACIKGLCKLGKWEESIKMLSNLSLNQFDLTPMYNVLIVALLEHREIELAKKYLNDNFAVARIPNDNVYYKYFEYCLENKQTFNKNIEDLFNLWKKYGVKPCHSVVTKCMDVCNEAGWRVKPTNLSTSVTCAVCKTKLKSSISEEEIAHLSEKLKERMFTDEIFLISNPNELKSFMKFIQNTKPYNVVIDALNVIYTNPHKRINTYNFIKHLSSKHRKILVIGRKHLRKLRIIKDIEKYVTVYFVENTTKDDLFILYAALESGKGTKMVTRDFMRQYKFALYDAELGVVFKRWQYLHQYSIASNLNNKLLLSHTVNNPNERYINIGIQKVNNYWHIPFCDKNSMRPDYINDHKWFCFAMPDNVGDT
ncbi:mitochondrial ribonuclease P catalytic subunit [Ptiloglossa arizonensis]|uniref:mitochondrial ribonuclease P catalytic subunit n=1 Tax=Ptiloglossa arizonensis TaxID=3350558 RepID=UPI003FA02CC5